MGRYDRNFSIVSSIRSTTSSRDTLVDLGLLLAVPSLRKLASLQAAEYFLAELKTREKMLWMLQDYIIVCGSR